ncbi:MAG: DUF1330 domain-containing protein [Alphaproteobacteria bacterium]|jgi:uncharacterized protein (DUF1330 family)|nr:DUF1330 domain-containing protein [Alphaproteobacteria bacterium]HJP22665.1 DUF1330 domain-containing protein [Alphaproteobacteria bacterium]
MTAYFVAQIVLHDAETYAKYTAQTPGIVADYGGRFIVRGGRWESLEGAEPGPRVVLIEFPSFEQAQAWYNSDAYQAILPLRQAASTGSAFLVEGAN